MTLTYYADKPYISKSLGTQMSVVPVLYFRCKLKIYITNRYNNVIIISTPLEAPEVLMCKCRFQCPVRFYCNT